MFHTSKNSILRVLTVASFSMGLLLAACSGSSATTSASFELALSIDGNGVVKSEPNALECSGPKDCGVQTIQGTTATLRATAAKGYGFLGWRRDDAPVVGLPLAEEYRIEAPAGAKTNVRALFGMIGGLPNGGGADGGGGGGGDGGTNPLADSGVAMEAGIGALRCGANACATSELCCVTDYTRAGAVPVFTCRTGMCDVRTQENEAVLCDATRPCPRPAICMMIAPNVSVCDARR